MGRAERSEGGNAPAAADEGTEAGRPVDWKAVDFFLYGRPCTVIQKRQKSVRSIGEKAAALSDIIWRWVQMAQRVATEPAEINFARGKQ